eukprot:s826_g4.t1
MPAAGPPQRCPPRRWLWAPCKEAGAAAVAGALQCEPEQALRAPRLRRSLRSFEGWWGASPVTLRSYNIRT